MSKRLWISAAEGFALYMAVRLGFPDAADARVLIVALVIIVAAGLAELWKDMVDGN